MLVLDIDLGTVPGVPATTTVPTTRAAPDVSSVATFHHAANPCDGQDVRLALKRMHRT